MLVAWDTIRASLLDTFANNKYLLLYIICLIYLFIFDKEKRRILVYPSLLISILIINPFLYEHVYYIFLKSVYWRMFWLFPIIPVIAAAAVSLFEHLKHSAVKVIAVIAVFFIIIHCGYYVYHHPLTQYEKAENLYKIPQSTIDIVDYLTSLESTPYVVMPADQYLYARQYSADIHLMYGRNAEGYISAIYNEHLEVFYMLNGMMDYDLQFVVDTMRGSHGLTYHYLVFPEESYISDETFASYGFTKINSIDGYGIYYLP
jgi:hypothetical protein